jgi:hypothetical protein
MQFILTVDLNLFAMVVLVIVLFSSGSGNHQRTPSHNLFMIMALANLSILTLDTITWILEGQMDPWLMFINNTFTVISCIINPIAPFIFYLYVDYQFSSNEKRTKRLAKYLSPLLLIPC